MRLCDCEDILIILVGYKAIAHNVPSIYDDTTAIGFIRFSKKLNRKIHLSVLTSSHEIDESFAERAVCVGQAFDGGEMMFGFLYE